MKRKEFLKKGLLAGAGVAAVLSACDNKAVVADKEAPNIITNKKYRWKMVTTWPKNFPILGESANLFAKWVNELTGGRIEIKVYGGGELVPALETFETVYIGAAEMGCGCAYYWAGKAPAAQFFGAVPFGMNAAQVSSWLLSGGGLELWQELYAQFNAVPFLGGNTGVQMGGWFNKEINSVKDLTGLKMRLPGLGGRALEKAGGAAVLVAGGDIFTSLERGVIDATEWIGPYHDYLMGFHKIAKYYYTPGWHECGSQLEFIINKKVFDGLPRDLQAAIEAASMRVQAWALPEADAKNGEYLDKMIAEENIQLRSFPQEVLDELRGFSEEAVQDLISDDPFARKVYESYSGFQKKIGKWHALTEKKFYNQIQKVEGEYS
ncbi:MAG: TRAP transporter substrate-binding protein [Bacteroidia bacterium]|nr:TRAP transporter substrate-binding protein [Bacteroidia bacterium]